MSYSHYHKVTVTSPSRYITSLSTSLSYHRHVTVMSPSRHHHCQSPSCNHHVTLVSLSCHRHITLVSPSCLRHVTITALSHHLPPVSTIPAINLQPVANNGTISDYSHLKWVVSLYVNSTSQRCPDKIVKTFLIEDFFHLPPVSTTLTPVVHL